MRNKIISVVIGAGLLLAASTGAQAVTIDFEALNGPQAQGNSIFNPASPYQEDGFILTTGGGNNFAAWQDQRSEYTGSVALFTSINDSANFIQDSGNEFTVNSIDFAWAGIGSPTANFTTQVLGTNAAGDALSEICNVEISFSLATCQFSSNFTVSSLSLVQGTSRETMYQFDNINISSVPVPAALWLFGSGLFGLLGIVRKKRTFA